MVCHHNLSPSGATAIKEPPPKMKKAFYSPQAVFISLKKQKPLVGSTDNKASFIA
jgi:hypothetical protein